MVVLGEGGLFVMSEVPLHTPCALQPTSEAVSHHTPLDQKIEPPTPNVLPVRTLNLPSTPETHQRVRAAFGGDPRYPSAQVLGSAVSVFGFWVSGLEFRGSGSGFWVSGFGFRVPGFGFRVSGFRFQVSGSGYRVGDLR